MDIRDNVRYILEKRGMTQRELAEKLGVTTTAVGSYFRGNVTIRNLQRIADALGTTVETIVSEKPLYSKGKTIQEQERFTTATITCPHCGKEIHLTAQE